jgi:hypothetical protein
MPFAAALLVAAAACADWHGQVVGHYLGQVESEGPKAIDTWIEAAPDGALTGTYTLHEARRDVPGTLEYLGDDGCDAALFRWTDLYGTGVARLRFHPDQHCFEGAWGLDAPRDALYWRSCAQSAVTS